MMITHSFIRRYWRALVKEQSRRRKELRYEKYVEAMCKEFPRPDVITKELIYAVGGPIKKSIRMLNLTTLPIIDAKTLIRVTQIPSINIDPMHIYR